MRGLLIAGAEWRKGCIPYKAGEICYCFNGHPMYRLKKDIAHGEQNWTRHLEFCFAQKEPAVGAQFTCDICGDHPHVSLEHLSRDLLIEWLKQYKDKTMPELTVGNITFGGTATPGGFVDMPCENPDAGKLPLPSSKGMDFSEALKAMKAGYRVARTGWNGKKMWIALGGVPKHLEAANFWNPHARDFAKSQGGSALVEPYILMKTARDTIQIGWLATQSDILADDWEVING